MNTELHGPDDAGDPTARWLAAFGKRLGTPAIMRNEYGVLGLRYGDLDIVVETDAGHVYLHVVLAPLPENDQHAFYAQLLRLNAYCIATGGASLALAPDGASVLLCLRQLINGLDEGRFGDMLDNFIRHAESLQRKMLAGERSPAHVLYV